MRWHFSKGERDPFWRSGEPADPADGQQEERGVRPFQFLSGDSTELYIAVARAVCPVADAGQTYGEAMPDGRGFWITQTLHRCFNFDPNHPCTHSILSSLLNDHSHLYTALAVNSTGFQS